MPYVKRSIIERMICRLEKARAIESHNEIKRHIDITLLYLKEIRSHSKPWNTEDHCLSDAEHISDINQEHN